MKRKNFNISKNSKCEVNHMILSELVEACKIIGKECDECPHYGQCEDYSESMRHAPVLDFTSEEESDEFSS